MSQLPTVLMTDHLISAQGGVTWSTVVFPGSTGIETRNNRWQNGRHAWTLTWQGYLAELQPVIDLFTATRGIWKSFKFSPPGYAQGDFRFDTDQLQVNYQVGQAGFIATISLNVIQVLDE